MTHWGALPPRQASEALTSIDYRGERDGQGRVARQVAFFRHRDGRIWEARIGDCSTTVEDTHYSTIVEVTSAGCRACRFLSKSLDQAQRTVNRFANLALDRYERIIADARGTTDFPRSNEIGVFRMNVRRQQQTGANQSQTHRYTLSGIARIDHGTITMFPTSEELDTILTDVCIGSTIALVPQGINVLQGQRSFSQRAENAFQNESMPDLTDDEVEAAISRLHEDTAERVIAGLQTGAYRSTRSTREERVIEFGDSET